MYDLVAGRQIVKRSYFIGKRKALEHFPILKSENLCGAIVYYDGECSILILCQFEACTKSLSGTAILALIQT